MKKIIIKEIDRLQSKLFKDKIVSEYLIYYIENDIKIETMIALGTDNKNTMVDKTLQKYCKSYTEIIIEIIKFEEHKNNINE